MLSRSFYTLFVAVMIAICAALAGAQIPEDVAALFNRAQDLHEKGDLAAAVEEYAKAIAVLPEFPEAEYQRAAALDSLGRKDEALKGYLRAAKLRPEWVAANSSAGSLLVHQGKYTEGLPFLEKALVSAPSDALALSAMTELRIKTNADEAVLKELLAKITSLTKNPRSDSVLRDARVALESAIAARETKAAAEGTVAELEKQLSSEPKNAAILGRLCREYRKASPAKALEYCRRASEAEPNNVDHAVGFGAALVQAKQYGTAVDLLRKLLVIAPDNWTAHANLATALFQAGRFAEAAPEYDWLAQKQPNAAAPHFFLAVVRDRLGELRAAMTEYQAYLKLADPNENKDDIERVNLRLPTLAKEIKKSRK
jgi:tetratricopeptide (TPR) repeat protein